MGVQQIPLKMKKRVLSLLIFSLSINPVAAQTRNPGNQPQIATVTSMTNGDLMCYVTLVDDRGIKHESVGATFEICNNEKTFLNQRVNLIYGRVRVNDCQSAEPCGKTRWATLITQMKLVDNRNTQAPQIELIGRGERSSSYRLTIKDSGNILFVNCPANYAPKLSLLRNEYAIQCQPL